jgi:hypothetical protein
LAYIAPIVEGQGEREAVPALLHKLKRHLNLEMEIQLDVNEPIRVKSDSFVNDTKYFEKYLSLAAAKARERGGAVLIILDCDDDCPAELGPQLLAKAQTFCGDIRIVVVLAYREFETWFVAAVESLRGKFGFAKDITRPATFDMRDAKGWLGQRMSSKYDPVIHQLKFVRAFDVEQAKAVPSFNRLCSRMHYLLGMS